MQEQYLLEKQVDLQQQKYTVQQDFIYVMQTIIDANEVLKYFNNEPDHPMITVTLNRLICQLNLSNTIHFGQKQTAESKNINEQLMVSKNQCKNLCLTYFQNYPIDSKLQPYLDHYLKQNLDKNTVINQLKGLPTINQKSQFNSEIVQKVFNGMAQTDKSYQSIRNGEKIETLTMFQLEIKLENRRQQTVEKIQKNWSQSNKDNGQNYNYIYYTAGAFISAAVVVVFVYYKYDLIIKYN